MTVELDQKTKEKLQDIVEDVSIDKLFKDAELSEETVVQLKGLFEIAVNEAVKEKQAALDEEFETRLAEETAKIEEKLTADTDAYLSYVAEQWVEENRIAVESGVKVEIAEGFINGLKNLLAEHNIDLSTEEISQVELVKEEKDAVQADLVKAITKINEQQKELVSIKKAQIFFEKTKDMSEAQAEKVKELVAVLDENKTPKEYALILESLSHNLVEGNSKEDNKEVVEIKENIESDDDSGSLETVEIPESMKAYASAISRQVKIGKAA